MTTQPQPSLANIGRSIWLIRGQRVMLDTDLARFYGVSTRRLNEQVKRNLGRFPADFMFRLSEKEKREVVALGDGASSIKFSRMRPLVFTEHGAVMAASVLNSPMAIRASVLIVRAFIRLRDSVLSGWELRRILEEHASKLTDHDEKIDIILDALRGQENEAPGPVRRIGFQP